MAHNALAVGSVLPGELTLEHWLGNHVYRARRVHDGRELAVRAIFPRTPALVAECLTLAAAASRVRHPSLASVETYGRLEDGGCYIASEYVPGRKLDQWADGVGIPPLAQVVELVRRLCLGLSAAESAGVVHDALNPRNVRVIGAANDTGLRTPIKLLDVGVGTLGFDHRHDPVALRFMAPEQLELCASDELPQSFRCSATMNVYSCGALLYYLTTGGPPFIGANASELRAAQKGALIPPARINPQISDGLNAVIARALSLDPSERWGSVAALGDALSQVVVGVIPRARSESSMRLSVPTFGDNPTLETSVDEINPELDGPPTFKAERPPALQGPGSEPPTAELKRIRHETPTVPPLAAPSELVVDMAELNEGVSGVSPIGLFSSAPPYDKPERRSRSIVEPLREESPSVAPPSVYVPPTAAGELIVVSSESQALAQRASRPYLGVSRRRREMWKWWLLPVGFVASVAGFFGVRALTSPPPTTNVVTATASTQPSTPRAEGAVPSKLPGATRTYVPEAVERSQPEAAAAQSQGSASSEPVATQRESARSRDRSVRPRGPAPSAARHEQPAESEAAPAEPVAPAPEIVAPSPAVAREVPAAVEAAPSAAPEARVSAAAAPQVASSRSVPPPSAPQKPLSAPVHMDIGSFAVRGSLPSSHVRRAVERIRSTLESCYKRAAQAAGHHGFGESIVEVHIDERGRASAPRVRGGQLPRLDACIADTVSKLICDKVPDTGTVLASWKVTFSP